MVQTRWALIAQAFLAICRTYDIQFLPENGAAVGLSPDDLKSTSEDASVAFGAGTGFLVYSDQVTYDLHLAESNIKGNQMIEWELRGEPLKLLKTIDEEDRFYTHIYHPRIVFCSGVWVVTFETSYDFEQNKQRGTSSSANYFITLKAGDDPETSWSDPQLLYFCADNDVVRCNQRTQWGTTLACNSDAEMLYVSWTDMIELDMWTRYLRVGAIDIRSPATISNPITVLTIPSGPLDFVPQCTSIQFDSRTQRLKLLVVVPDSGFRIVGLNATNWSGGIEEEVFFDITDFGCKFPSRRLSLHIDGDGKTVAFMGAKNCQPNGDSSYLWFATSEDGVDFSPLTIVATNNDIDNNTLDGAWDIQTDPTDGLWIASVLSKDKRNNQEGGLGVYYVVSTDGARTFSNLNGPIGTSSYLDLPLVANNNRGLWTIMWFQRDQYFGGPRSQLKLTSWSSSPDFDSSTTRENRSDTGLIAGISVGFAVFIAGAAAIFVVLKRRWNNANNSEGVQIELEEGKVELNLLENITRGDLIGTGQYGNVYKGTYKGKEVALKEVKAKSGHLDALEDIKKEATLNSYIPPHPNVVRFLGVSLGTDAIFLVSDLYSGGSLDKAIKGGNIDAKQQIRWAADIACGMVTATLCHMI
eukprot:TRINITY_DN4515_c0_g1_i1.p1 TRINITY_DN4515_c0_g1~~TRINITY_DN4515_c0_g1_i1.p1  ORF type:complete len:639 (-),score=66.90 TRINITY_DN4515_c0_g1_i1:490-2406(-)